MIRHNFIKIRFIVLAVIIAAFAGTCAADALSDFISSPAINAPQTSVYIADLKNDTELVAHNVSTPLIPASIMKSVTIATLLEKVGPRKRPPPKNSAFHYEPFTEK